MKASLVFAPPANPTYTPLGIATLAEYIRHKEPQVQIETLDLNISTWHLLADRSEWGRACRHFMQGKTGDFFDRPQYAAHQQAVMEIGHGLEKCLSSTRQYLEGGDLTGDLKEMLDYWATLVLQQDPELIGLSIMYPRQVLTSLALAKYLKSILHESGRAERRIVLGGATISALNPQEILQACSFVDAVVGGEGERALQMLCRGEAFEKIGGLSFRRPGRIVTNRKQETLSLMDIPLPSFDGVDLAAYLNPEPVASVIFSRGCMWRQCRFCAHNFSYSGYRRRAIVPFVDHLAKVNASKGVRHFYFADQYVDADDMKCLADEIIRKGLDIAFHLMGRPTASYTAEVCRRLYEAGCRWISWGVESGSQRLLDVCSKGTRVETIERVVRNAHEAGIANLVMMIFGLPTSCDSDLDATFDLLDALADVTDDITSSSFQLWGKTAFAANPAAFGLKITGREHFFDSPSGPVHSLRLFYRETVGDGTLRLPSGPLEIARWQRRQRLVGRRQELEGLSCEHTLLYTARRSAKRSPAGPVPLCDASM
ncbi:MAG: B12-binding domain-containing radical SAM protein [Phycisphaerae bacterium]|nr:B12-binding domain-containing radical SAM protein [Phycisphaerae bacterium]